MIHLLKNDFTAHYGLNAAHISVVVQNTNAPYFEIEDIHGIIHIFTIAGQGTAAYSNPNPYSVSIINYEQFINDLPNAFQQGRKKCDALVYTLGNPNYFLLNEFTDTQPMYVNDFVNNSGFQTGKRTKAIGQMIQSLRDLMNVIRDLMNVKGINNFISQFLDKRCCFFNKKINAPVPITATTSFNRNNTLVPNGIQSRNQDIENYGFTFWEFWGGQVFEL